MKRTFRRALAASQTSLLTEPLEESDEIDEYDSSDEGEPIEQAAAVAAAAAGVGSSASAAGARPSQTASASVSAALRFRAGDEHALDQGDEAQPGELGEQVKQCLASAWASREAGGPASPMGGRSRGRSTSSASRSGAQ